MLHLEARSERQHVLSRHPHIFHADRSRHRSPQGKLSLDLDRGEARHALHRSRRTCNSVGVSQSWNCCFLARMVCSKGRSSRTCARRVRLRALITERLRGTRRECPSRVPFSLGRGILHLDGWLQVPAGHVTARLCFAKIIKTVKRNNF